MAIYERTSIRERERNAILINLLSRRPLRIHRRTCIFIYIHTTTAQPLRCWDNDHDGGCVIKIITPRQGSRCVYAGASFIGAPPLGRCLVWPSRVAERSEGDGGAHAQPRTGITSPGRLVAASHRPPFVVRSFYVSRVRSALFDVSATAHGLPSLLPPLQQPPPPATLRQQWGNCRLCVWVSIYSITLYVQKPLYGNIIIGRHEPHGRGRIFPRVRKYSWILALYLKLFGFAYTACWPGPRHRGCISRLFAKVSKQRELATHTVVPPPESYSPTACVASQLPVIYLVFFFLQRTPAVGGAAVRQQRRPSCRPTAVFVILYRLRWSYCVY